MPPTDAALETWSRRAPWLILAYAAGLAALRVWLSPFLEVDEAHFVGQLDLRLAYGNSQPPLYNWLFRGAWEIAGGRWALAAALVKFPLLAAFHLLSWDAARRLAGPAAGLMAAAASAFLPQIVWMSPLTLTHSVLVLAAAAAVVHAGALLAVTPRAKRGVGLWLWLGAAMALGAMAKYTFALMLGPFLLALLVTPGTRGLVADRRFLVSLAAFAALAGPSIAAAALQVRQTTGRMSKLFSEEGSTAGLDVPGIGLDGFLSLIQAGLAWAGPALVVWWLARRRAQPQATSLREGADAYVEALGRAMALGLALFAVIVLAGDMHRVRERYLTPMLAPLPVWARGRPSARRAGGGARSGAGGRAVSRGGGGRGGGGVLLGPPPGLPLRGGGGAAGRAARPRRRHADRRAARRRGEPGAGVAGDGDRRAGGRGALAGAAAARGSASAGLGRGPRAPGGARGVSARDGAAGEDHGAADEPVGQDRDDHGRAGGSLTGQPAQAR